MVRTALYEAASMMLSRTVRASHFMLSYSRPFVIYPAG